MDYSDYQFLCLGESLLVCRMIGERKFIQFMLFSKICWYWTQARISRGNSVNYPFCGRTSKKNAL